MVGGVTFINTPLQRRDVVRTRASNRFSGFSFCNIPDTTVETVKAVEIDAGRSDTSLKRGVNESQTLGYRESVGRSFK
jgi:hypothetical protein